MNTKTIYLIRHGETEFNRLGVVQGSGIDAPLNEKGFSQGKAFFEYYKNVKFNKIYTSKLIRTVQTIQNFIDLGIPFEQYEGLNEISWGEKEGKTPNYLEDEFYLKIIGQWKRGETHIPSAPKGESPQDVANRQKAVIDLIISRKEEETILIAMHGRAMRILLAQIIKNSLSEMDEFEHSNTCLYKLNYSYKTNQFSLKLANDTRHLF